MARIKQITVWRDKEELIDTEYGKITYEEWLTKELPRLQRESDTKYKIKHYTGSKASRMNKVAMFIK